MNCQEAAFTRGTCRIEIDQRPLGPGLPEYVAHLWIIDRSGRPSPLVLRDGSPAEIRGETEALALSSALVYLESRFGTISEYVHACLDDGPHESGPPTAIDRA
ncbi:MAG TPA: hypothetical protein VJN96_25420 [Vicinamibacterales bacterium]|nr:hypothetical protein [Vicinamibacterales bacterium]